VEIIVSKEASERRGYLGRLRLAPLTRLTPDVSNGQTGGAPGSSNGQTGAPQDPQTVKRGGEGDRIPKRQTGDFRPRTHAHTHSDGPTASGARLVRWAVDHYGLVAQRFFVVKYKHRERSCTILAPPEMKKLCL
jgi:hypothetical protein